MNAKQTTTTLLARRASEGCIIRGLKVPRLRGGLTMVEMLVVLTILALVTLVAVQATEYVVDQGRYDVTQQTLQNIQNAIIGPAGQRSQDGSLLITGFVADMGRLPQPVFVNGVIVGDPLRELWDGTLDANTLAPLALYSNQSVNIVNQTVTSSTSYLQYPASTTYNPTTAAVNVTGTLPSGWRGPYLQLPVGSGGFLFDGWGTPFQSLYQVPGSATVPGVFVPGTGPASIPPVPVNIVRSLGGDNLPDSGLATNPYFADQYIPTQLSAPPTLLPLVNFSDRINASVMVQVMTYDTRNQPPNPTPPYSLGANANDDTVQIVFFAPVNGTLVPTYAVKKATNSPAYFSITTSYTPVCYTFSNVAIGPRAVQAFQFGAASGLVSKRSQMAYLMVPTGGVPTQTLILQ